MTKTWNPSQLEQRCLEQLDHAENWRLLDRARPHEEEILPWRPFGRIFWFNLAVFGPVIALLAAGVGHLAEFEASDIPGTIAFVIVASVGMAFLAAGLYRRSWNRRAKWLRRDAEEG